MEKMQDHENPHQNYYVWLSKLFKCLTIDSYILMEKMQDHENPL